MATIGYEFNGEYYGAESNRYGYEGPQALLEAISGAIWEDIHSDPELEYASEDDFDAAHSACFANTDYRDPLEANIRAIMHDCPYPLDVQIIDDETADYDTIKELAEWLGWDS